MSARERFALGASTLVGDTGMVNQVLALWDESGLFNDPSWDNVPMHCLKVAEVANCLARLVVLDPEEAKIAITAGLLHDIFKRLEKTRIKALIDGGMSEGHAYSLAATEQEEYLSGFGGAMVEAARVSALSGHNSLAYFEADDRPLFEKIFHVADDLCGDKVTGIRRGDMVVLLSVRIDQLKEYYPFLVSEHPESLGGRSWIEVQEEVTTKILNELAWIGKVGTGLDLNRVLVQLGNESSYPT